MVKQKSVKITGRTSSRALRREAEGVFSTMQTWQQQETQDKHQVNSTTRIHPVKEFCLSKPQAAGTGIKSADGSFLMTFHSNQFIQVLQFSLDTVTKVNLWSS